MRRPERVGVEVCCFLGMVFVDINRIGVTRRPERCEGRVAAICCYHP